MTEEDQANVVLRVAKSHWFANELREHPVVIWANNKNIRVNEIGLAQHYELETGYIDLTHSFDVAAFFATCYRKDSVWKPMEEGSGVIYRYDVDTKAPFVAEPVSLQPLPRRKEQCAWLLETPFECDFETHPSVT